ncbi:Putative ribonuclease H protein [Dendrobium catenatum]|uniref:Ribonuclease H protein n=1 Tax=Dendrobium catenatum TaxID=906689 RepID=A0A2I0VDW5_9ASPA|nr:Putative ribonuclease H protein [Dendrobium catenatum]
MKMDANIIIDNVKRKVLQLFNFNILSSKIFYRCKHLAVFFEITLDQASPNMADSFVYWIKPKLPYVKLNTDGSVGLKTAGAGGIIRDFCGEVVVAFATPLQTNDVISAELNALILGLELCIKYGCNSVLIELDAIFIVQSIKDGATGNANYFYLFRKVKNIMNEMNVFISHIYREGNVCADWLANRGSTLYDYEELNILNLDKVLKGMLLLDKACMPYFRTG